MQHHYIKDFPRGTSKELGELDELLPICTDHLNAINSSLSMVRKMKEFAVRANSDIVDKLTDLEAQGAFNTYLNLCFLDFIVVYKNALRAVHLWEDISALRQGYLLIYEALKTYQSHSKGLKDLCSKTVSTQAFFADLTAKIKRFKKDYDYDNSISAIRNYTIGHIEKDPVNFFIKISQFDEDKAFSALKEFVSVLVDMMNLSEHIFTNHTKKIVGESSIRLAGLNEFASEMNQLISVLDQQPFMRRNRAEEYKRSVRAKFST